MTLQIINLPHDGLLFVEVADNETEEQTEKRLDAILVELPDVCFYQC